MLKMKLLLISSALLVFLAGCSSNHNPNAAQSADPGGNSQVQNNSIQGTTNHGNMEMDHSGTGELPKGLKAAKNPAFKVGSRVVILADHMPGMKGALGTVKGAFDMAVAVAANGFEFFANQFSSTDNHWKTFRINPHRLYSF